MNSAPEMSWWVWCLLFAAGASALAALSVAAAQVLSPRIAWAISAMRQSKIKALFLLVFVIGMIQYGATKGTNGNSPSACASSRSVQDSTLLISPVACDSDSLYAGGSPVTNFMFCGIERYPESVFLDLAWPDSFSFINNRIDLYCHWCLATNNWHRIAQVDLSNSSSNAVIELPNSILPTNALCKAAFFIAADQSDSDGDGLSDTFEKIVSGSGPAAPDTDGDGVLDGEEIRLGTECTAADSDKDGLSDAEELGTVTVLPPAETWWRYFGEESEVWSSSYYGSAGSFVVNLPCPYTVNGVVYSQIRVCVDGLIYLLSPENPQWGFMEQISIPPQLSATLLSSKHIAIAGFCADLYVRAKTWGSKVCYGSTDISSGRASVIEFCDFGFASDVISGAMNLFTFQLILPSDESNVFYLTYRPIPSSYYASNNPTIGVQCPMLNPRTQNEAYYNLTLSPSDSFFSSMRTVRFFIGCGTDPKKADTDGDGFSDGEEVAVLKTDPNASDEDSDNDGLPDAVEILMGSNAERSDTDYDGLSDLEEFSLGLNILQPDTDGDGMNDGWENEYGLAPQESSGDDGADGDPDYDGLLNIDEYLNGTNPHLPDTDGDGISDADEVANGSDPNDASDSGQAPPVDKFREIEFNINGDYAAWEMTIEGLGPNDVRIRKISMGRPNAANTNTLKMRKGNSYRLSMRWLNCDGHNDNMSPWYCWQAQLDGMPSGQTFLNYTNARCEGYEVVVGDGWIADNEDGLLTAHVHECTTRSDGSSGGGNVAGGLTATLYVLDDPRLIPDYDRNGEVGSTDKEIYDARQSIFRFWINNDNDSGNTNDSRNDCPGSGSNGQDDKVNGRGDLLDFTPIVLDVSEVFPPGTPDHIKELVLWKLESSTANAVWTSLEPSEAGNFHKADCGAKFGPQLSQIAHEATVSRLFGDSSLPNAFLSHMKNSGDKGVVMIEGCASGTDLRLKGYTAESSSAVLEGKLPISISPVEDMYRWFNVRGLSGEVVDFPSRLLVPPNFPDNDTSDRHLVFVHGANVTQDGARGWASEIFKRMWQTGMTAKFTAVTWRSDIGSDANYHENVSNAFFTASAIAQQIKELPGIKVLMAHSLGNMVCSSMIQDYELVPDCYLMCNSAVPAEAYDTDPALRVPQLVHPEWVKYPTNSWASSWHCLFRNEPSDDRRLLGWPGRFSNVAQYAVNFYSTGDEVLELANNNNVHSWTGVFDSWGHYAWHKQELFKGRGGVGGTDWAGWNIEENWLGINKISVTEAQSMKEADFRTNTVFYCYPPSMNSTNIALLVRGAHLAQGIPALTSAAGQIRFGDTRLRNDSFDCNTTLQIARPNGWPERSDYQGQWCHSDMKDVAYFYVYNFYEKIIEKGNLK